MSAPENAIPLLVLSDRRRQVLAAMLVESLAPQCGAWVREAELRVITVPELRRQGVEPVAGRLCSLAKPRTSSDACFVFFSDALLQSIFAGGAQMSEHSADGPIAIAVQREIEEAIARSLASSLKLQVNSSLEHRLLSDCHVSAGQDRWVACSLIVRSGAPLIVVLLHPAVVDEIAPGATKVSLDEPVVRRRNAIGMECVRAEVLLGHVDVSCADLARLSIGDVLVLNEPLSGAARLQSMQGELIAPVNIGRVGDLTAVQVN